MAFVRGDVLGTHVSNLALRSFSSVVVPVDIGLSDNIYLACRYANKEKVELLYTNGNGQAEMFAAGCDSTLRYVVDGILQTRGNPQYLDIPANFDIDMTTKSAALMLMPRGVLPYSNAGNLATGHNSTVAFARQSDVRNGQIRLRVRGVEGGPLDRSLVISVNGEVVTENELSIRSDTNLVFPIGIGNAKDAVEISFTCSWSDSEIRKIETYENPPACFKFLNMTVENVRS
jgi:hypothetical protein